MNAIVGFCGFINNPELPAEKRKEFTDIIVNSSNQLLSIITDLISIATIETGQEKINKNRTNINSVCRLIYDQFFSKAHLKNIEFNYNTALYDDEAYITIDEPKLVQIISNLLNNAFKFTAKGYVSFGYKVKKNDLEFYVKDTGIGIPSKLHEKIFNRFYQIEYSASRQYGGSGLGLSISRAYAELLGGYISLTSKPGKGSTFYFTIPFNQVFPSDLSDQQIAYGELIKFETPKIIVIAEDEDFNYMLLEEFLAESDISIMRAVNGMEAVDICKSNKNVDLVLMDIKMPVMNGYEATKKIKEFMPDLPVIAQTAYSTEKERAKAIECGCCDFISKPIEKDLFISKINEYILAEKRD